MTHELEIQYFTFHTYTKDNMKKLFYLLGIILISSIAWGASAFNTFIDPTAGYNLRIATSVPSDWWTDGLVGYWNFDGKNTTSTLGTRDTSGQNNWGTFSGGVKPRAGVVGQALSFDGVDDYVEVADSDDFSFTAGNSFSVEAWIYMETSPDNYDQIVGKWDNNHPSTKEWLFRFDTNDIFAFWLYDGDASRGRKTTDTIPTGQWTHIIGTNDGSTGNDANVGTKIYINGVQKDTTDISTAGTYDGMNNTTAKLFLGANEDTVGGISNLFNGLMDEVRIYDRALSAEEIKMHYEQSRRNLRL